MIRSVKDSLMDVLNISRTTSKNRDNSSSVSNQILSKNGLNYTDQFRASGLKKIWTVD